MTSSARCAPKPPFTTEKIAAVALNSTKPTVADKFPPASAIPAEENVVFDNVFVRTHKTSTPPTNDLPSPDNTTLLAPVIGMSLSEVIVIELSVTNAVAEISAMPTDRIVAVASVADSEPFTFIAGSISEAAGNSG